MAGTSLLLFDLNGVLYRYDREARIAYLHAVSARSPEAITSEIWDPGFKASGDAGALGADEYLRGFGARIGADLSEAEWLAAQQVTVTPIPHTLALLPHVRAGVDCAALTNNNLLVRRQFATLYPEVAARTGIRAYVSAELGARKPDPDAYGRCLARLGVAATATLFIDDGATNVVGAREAGLHGHDYTGSEALAAELGSLGLLAA